MSNPWWLLSRPCMAYITLPNKTLKRYGLCLQLKCGLYAIWQKKIHLYLLHCWATCEEYRNQSRIVKWFYFYPYLSIKGLSLYLFFFSIFIYKWCVESLPIPKRIILFLENFYFITICTFMIRSRLFMYIISTKPIKLSMLYI